MSDVLTIENLSYRRNWKTILTDVSLQLPAGQIIGLLGANGAGKTTLMRLIAGSAVQFKGQIQVGGQTALARRKAGVSYTGQLTDIDPRWKVGQIAELMAQLHPDFRMADFLQLADLLDLQQKQRFNRLSKGNQRKLALAVTMARRAQLYLLDEPFDGIDVMTRKAMLNSIVRWLPDTATMVISDHHVTDIDQLLDAVVVIKNQTIVAHAAADAIREGGQSIESYFEQFYDGGENDD